MRIDSFAKDNKYTKWYKAIIINAQKRASNRKNAKLILGHCEGHHVIPLSIWRSKHNTELAYLTTKEHFVVHHLLVYMTDGATKERMIEAIMQFSQGRNLTPRQSAICMLFKHSPCSEKRRKNISQARLNTTKLKCSYCEAMVDPGNYKRFHGENCKHNPNIDQLVLEERSRKNQLSAMKSIKNGTHKTGSPISLIPIICPYCEKVGYNKPVMIRFHFECCKHREVLEPDFQ